MFIYVFCYPKYKTEQMLAAFFAVFYVAVMLSFVYQTRMSNVDLSSEFTEMITTQRGFQANSRIITVSDTLLEELINLKR